MPDILHFLFKDAGTIPNNQKLPAVVYKRAAQSLAIGTSDLAGWFEAEWPKHGWRAAWRWGVYDFPHYHSTAHEILGVFRGNAMIKIGDRVGTTIFAEVGDVLVLPAGTAHQNLGSSSDFQVVGGYPEGQQADLLRGEKSERPAADERIAKVPLPKSDPLTGATGELVKLWGIK